MYKFLLNSIYKIVYIKFSQTMHLIALHASFFFYDSIFLSWAKQRISQSGKEREIPYDPIYMTSHTISQPNSPLRHQELGKVLLEHQQA